MKFLKTFLTLEFAAVAACIGAQVFVIIPFVNSLAEERVTKQFRKELIERGCAEYNSETGEWQYKKQFMSEPKVDLPKKEQEDFSDLDRLALIPDHFPLPKKQKSFK
jgi:hypothetical protein